MKVDMFEAKTQLPQSAQRAINGERGAGEPIVDLVSPQEATSRKPGGNEIVMDDFDQADEAIAELFEGAS
jgi:hypothetical protein